MGKDIHDIELFRRLIAPRHTAFNVRISEKSSADRKTKESKSKKKKPPPERWSHTEPLNVHLQNRIGVSLCRAPPDQRFFRETGQIFDDTEEKAMWLNNNGQTETEILQNRFTAYLSKAIRRRRNEYIQWTLKKQQTEYLTESLVSDLEYNLEQKLLNELPLMIRLENDALLQALKEINQRERDIFLARVLDEKSFGELANEYGLSYKGAAAVYYRTVRKIKNRIGEI